jgi:LPXTG-site transpeptidase (sortase) family protein
LLVFGLLTGITGIVLVISAFGAGDSDDVTLEVESVVASFTPDTVAPRVTTQPVTTQPAATGPTPVAAPPAAETPSTTSTTTIPLSPLAALLGPGGNAYPPEIEPRLRPASLEIPELDVEAPVRSVGLRTDGALEVPGASEIGWYQYGAAPGYQGATVLAAHVSWNGDLGVFHRLGDLDPGARVEITLEDGSQRTYEIIERTMYDKDALPRERIWRNTGDETLVLITCGGSFNPEITRYRQNIVVYAVPVA